MSHVPAARVAEHKVLSRLSELVAHDRATTAEMLELIGVAEARRLYAPKSCESMFAYCVRRLGMSEDMAYKRIQAARAARKFPSILAMIADGRLHLTGVVRLAPYLTPVNASELLAAATHRSKRALEQLLAERFPMPGLVSPPAATPSSSVPTLGPVAGPGSPAVPLSADSVPAASLAPAPDMAPVIETPDISPMSCQLVPEPVAPAAPPASVTMFAPGIFDVRFRFGPQAHEKLRRAQELLSHAMPSGDLAQVFERALDELIQKLEKRKFGATSRPKSDALRRRPAHERTIPNAIKRAVHERDGDRCTFVGDDGQRCESQDLLEFDHVTPLSRGGLTTASNLRLLCRTHNRYEAERMLGAGFIERRRERVRNEHPHRPARAAGKPPESSPFPGPHAVP